MSLGAIAKALNDTKGTTAKGNTWTPVQIDRVIKRLQAAPPVRSRLVVVEKRKIRAKPL